MNQKKSKKKIKSRWKLLPGVEPTEMDLKILEAQEKGILVPTRKLIKTPQQIEGIRKAGVIFYARGSDSPGPPGRTDQVFR